MFFAVYIPLLVVPARVRAHSTRLVVFDMMFTTARVSVDLMFATHFVRSRKCVCVWRKCNDGDRPWTTQVYNDMDPIAKWVQVKRSIPALEIVVRFLVDRVFSLLSKQHASCQRYAFETWCAHTPVLPTHLSLILNGAQGRTFLQRFRACLPSQRYVHVSFGTFYRIKKHNVVIYDRYIDVTKTPHCVLSRKHVT